MRAEILVRILQGWGDGCRAMWRMVLRAQREARGAQVNRVEEGVARRERGARGAQVRNLVGMEHLLRSYEFSRTS